MINSLIHFKNKSKWKCNASSKNDSILTKGSIANYTKVWRIKNSYAHSWINIKSSGKSIVIKNLSGI